MTQATLAGIPSATEVREDLRKREADYTPRPIVHECLRAAMPKALNFAAQHREPDGPAHVRVLDLCAGAGVWGDELAKLWRANSGGPRSDLHITAVEIDEREREHLERVVDRVIIGDWTRAIGRHTDSTGHRPRKRPVYDVVIGNPPFTLLPAQRNRDGDLDPELSMPARLLSVAPAVLLLSRLMRWSKDAPGVMVRRKYPPAFCWEIPGGVSFRAEGTTDQHPYAVFLWLRGYSGPTQTELLRDFSPAERRWSVRPGTER